MVLRIKTSFAVFIVLFIYLSSVSLGQSKCFINGASSMYSLHEGGSVRVKYYARKLLSHNVVDYDDAGANPKHDPRGRRGGKNP